MRIRSSRPTGAGHAASAPTKNASGSWWRRRSTRAVPANAPAAQSVAAERDAPPELAGASELLVSLARRSQALLYRQLARLDDLEARDLDADTLADLFVVDHLATRMRRNAESLLVLAGEESARGMSRPVPLSEAIRGAMAEIEEYERVDVTVQGEAELSGRAVADVVHLLAELVENAVSFSPPDSRVAVHGARTRDGYVITITDRGVGLEPALVERYNARLARYDDADDLEAGSMLGFRVVRRIATRHDVGVRLVSQVDHGTVVTVEIPATLLLGADPAPGPAEQPVQAAPAPPVPDTAPASGAPPRTIGAPRQYFPDGIVPPGYEVPPPPVPIPAVPIPAEPPPAAAAFAAASRGAGDLAEPAVDDPYEFGTDPAGPTLARRVPQDSIAPQMRGASVSPTLPSATASVPEPERSRSLLAAYSNGLTLGRSAIPDHPGDAGTADTEGLQ